jgi:hypothetical protein
MKELNIRNLCQYVFGDIFIRLVDYDQYAFDVVLLKNNNEWQSNSIIINYGHLQDENIGEILDLITTIYREYMQ